MSSGYERDPEVELPNSFPPTNFGDMMKFHRQRKKGGRRREAIVVDAARYGNVNDNIQFDQ